MKRFRKTSRPVLRRRNRSCLRRALPRRPGPDELSQALTAFFRAVRCHRRLAKLAPRFFDAAIVDQEAFHRAERRCWMETWRPALNRAYGHDPDTPLPDDSDPLPPLPSPAIQCAVEHELQELQRWMAVGRTAMETYPQRHPHALPTFSQIARLLRLALEFRQLACGMSSSGAAPPPPSLNYDSVLADLERAYPRTSGEGDVAAPSPAPAPVVATPPKAPPAPPPSNAKPDLVPYALVIGPHGLPCLERVDPET